MDIFLASSADYTSLVANPESMSQRLPLFISENNPMLSCYRITGGSFMPSFSQRKGLKPITKAIQVESIDDELRGRLWTAFLSTHYAGDIGDMPSDIEEYSDLLEEIWDRFLKRPIDNLSGSEYADTQILRRWFFTAKWNEVYDFIEFVIANTDDEDMSEEFVEDVNSLLKQESAGYQVIAGLVTDIISTTEVEEVGKAQESPLEPMNHHFRKALELLYDRKNPDYRNSVKESILALEALFKVVTGKSSSTLGEALKSIDPRMDIHPALAKAFSSMYGYTSTAEGIRHALLDKDKVKHDDARYFLVTCSAFSNYVISKASESGFRFSKK